MTQAYVYPWIGSTGGSEVHVFCMHSFASVYLAISAGMLKHITFTNTLLHIFLTVQVSLVHIEGTDIGTNKK